MATPRRLFVYEHLTGGGCGTNELPGELTLEGMAMLAAVLADCRAIDGLHTVTTLDQRLAHVQLPADEVLLVNRGRHVACFAEGLARCQAALVIAPETGGILAELSKRVVTAGRHLLGSDPEAVRIGGDKWACYERWRAAGIPTPLTWRADSAAAWQAADAIGYPLVVKPDDGVGCSGVALARSATDLAVAVEVARATSNGAPILFQRYVAGQHASISLLAAGGQVRVLSLNRQDVEAGCPFRYHGGVVPLVHPAAAQAMEAAVRAACCVPGLRGYVGVDLVLADGQTWVIELNPRLTTSYTGLRRVAGFNLMQAIWDASLHGRLPDSVELCGEASFNTEQPESLGGLEWLPLPVGT